MTEPTVILTAPAASIGLSRLSRTVFEGGDLTPLWNQLVARATGEVDDPGALLDLSALLQLTGSRDKGLELQAAALTQQRCFRTVHGAGGGLRILAFMIAGDFMANTPVDFLLEGSDAELTTYYLDGPPPSPSQLPEHDLAFMAIGQADESTQMLTGLEFAFRGWPRPVINGRPELIAALTRDGVAARFEAHPDVLAPPVCRSPRSRLLEVVNANVSLGDLADGLRFPVIVRPIGSHAGAGLEKLEQHAQLRAYLESHPQDEFFVTSYVDYSGSDGLFRKLRIVFVKGRPYIAHFAVSSAWMVHYLNAGMDCCADKRAEEAQMMATFETGFAARHARAFEALNEAFQLDYFGIDCAETAEGRLLLFEADVAMIVHDMDPVDLYPYKKPAMAKLFDGFVATMAGIARSVRRAA